MTTNDQAVPFLGTTYLTFDTETGEFRPDTDAEFVETRAAIRVAVRGARSPEHSRWFGRCSHATAERDGAEAPGGGACPRHPATET